MVKAFEFADGSDYGTLTASSSEMDEHLVAAVARERRLLEEAGRVNSDGAVEVGVIMRRLRDFGHEAIQIALSTGNEHNKFDYDAVDGLLYPPRRHAPTQRIRYM